MFNSFITAAKSRLAVSVIALGLMSGQACATGTLNAEIVLDPLPALCSEAGGPITISGSANISVSHLTQGLIPTPPEDAGASVSVGIYSNGILVDSFPAPLSGDSFSADISFPPVDGVACFDIIVDLTYNFDPVGDVDENGNSKWDTITTASEGLVPGPDNDVCFGVDDCGGQNGTGANLDPSIEKTCEEPQLQSDGTVTVLCDLSVDFPNGPPVDNEGNPVAVSVVDNLTLNGGPSGATVTALASSEPWSCSNGAFLPFVGATLETPSLNCYLDSNATAAVATSSVDGMAGMSVIPVQVTFPAGSVGDASNCASVIYSPTIDSGMYSLESCATFALPASQTQVTPAPVQCEAFTTEVTCNKATGKPVVTLKNKYSKLFNPKSVHITSLTPGVTVQQSNANALSVQLTGANPGDTISLTTEAVEKGAGSQPGLDLCCMGEISVKIPQGFVCEAEQVLEVIKTCDTGINPAIDTDADCEITVHYEGPPPSASNPIKIVEAVTGNPWAFTTTPLSGDNWHCPPVADATPFTCTISANDEPGANWQNWTSTLIVQMSVGEEFENCVTATAAGGLQDKVCWSTETPELTIEKLADQEQCFPGQPCTFTINISNPSGTDYTGPVTLNDQIVDVSPSVLTDPGTFTSIAPALCNLNDLTNGNCTGLASIPAGGTQSYTVTWVPPAMIDGAEQATVTNCVKGTSAHGDMTVANAPDGLFGEPAFGENQSCAAVTLLDGEISITKIGPEQCLPGQPCDFQITINAGAGGFNGPALLFDQAPTGFEVSSISPAPVGCGTNLPAEMFACVVPVSLGAGESVSYTIAVTPKPGTLDAAYFGENCAALGTVPEGTGPADYSFTGHDISEALSGLMGATTILGQHCVPVTWNPEDTSGDVTIAKTCTPLAEEDSAVLSYRTDCTITVTVTGEDGYGGHLQVSDVFTGPNGGTVGTLTPTTDDWTCEAEGCMIGPMGPGVYQVNVPVTGIMLNPGETATNCALGAGVATGTGMTEEDWAQFPQSCVTLTPPDVGNPDDVSTPPTIAKTCAAPVAGPFGLTIDCTIVVTSNANPQPDHLTVTETLGQYLDASDTGASITALNHTDPWTEAGQLPMPPATPFTLTMMGSDMPASGQSTISATVQLMDDGYLVETENCATVQAYDAANQPIGAAETACAFFTEPTQKVGNPTGPALTLAKTSTGACVPDVAAQTYACGFDLTVTNSGTGAYTGPMVLGDAFDAGMVSAVTATGAGWACNLAGDAASCINGNLSLAPGASSAVSLDVTVKGQREGGTFQNCGSIGASDGPKEQAMIVQTALTLMGVDIGAVDGQPGKRTRAAVADLQKQLGLEADGQINDALLSALGVPMAADAEPACVTVDLPPMPRPPVQCEKATTKLIEGECVCRFKNMYQADKTSCGCVKGTEFVAGEGCIKVREKVKDTPKALNCDPDTTVLRKGKCQCREEGMEKISKTACAKAKKKQELKICPNGLPEIPGVGCVDITFERKKKEADCDSKAITGGTGIRGAVASSCK